MIAVMHLHAPGHPMFQWLKALVARVRGRYPPFDRPLDDPYAGVRDPRPHSPQGRRSGAALAEPEPGDVAHAVARRRP
jgi:hypothetical protein